LASSCRGAIVSDKTYHLQLTPVALVLNHEEMEINLPEQYRPRVASESSYPLLVRPADF